MNVTQANPTPYKKTSIKISDISPKAPKVELFSNIETTQRFRRNHSKGSKHRPNPMLLSPSTSAPFNQA